MLPYTSRSIATDVVGALADLRALLLGEGDQVVLGGDDVEAVAGPRVDDPDLAGVEVDRDRAARVAPVRRAAVDRVEVRRVLLVGQLAHAGGGLTVVPHHVAGGLVEHHEGRATRRTGRPSRPGVPSVVGDEPRVLGVDTVPTLADPGR